MKPDFQFLEPIFFYCRSKSKNKYFGKKYFSVGRSSITRILGRNLKKMASYSCAELNVDSKFVLVFVLALMVFDFYSFEISKIDNPKNTKILIFSKKLFRKSKNFHNKKFFFFQFYICCVNFTSIGP